MMAMRRVGLLDPLLTNAGPACPRRALVAFLILSALFASGCVLHPRLSRVPSGYQFHPEESPTEGGKATPPPSRGKAYALDLVKASVAHVDAMQAGDFSVDLEGFRFSRVNSSTITFKNDITVWRRFEVKWAAITDCTSWSADGFAWFDGDGFRMCPLDCPGDSRCIGEDMEVQCKVVNHFDIPIANTKVLRDFVAGVRVLAGIDPDPAPWSTANPARPPAPRSRPSPAFGCQKDTDCKGTRVCENNKCVDR